MISRFYLAGPTCTTSGQEAASQDQYPLHLDSLCHAYSAKTEMLNHTEKVRTKK
jgi:hypothetical protein